MAKITKLQIDFLKVYLTCFGNAYISLMGKKIESIEQLCEIIENKVITFEDVWDDYLSRCFGERLNKNLTDDEEDFYYSNLEAYEYENYFTLDSKKDIGEGAWIKVRTTNGFEIHYAKKSTRKIRLNEVYEAEQNKVTK